MTGNGTGLPSVEILSRSPHAPVPWRNRTVVVVDVIRSATTAVTTVARGHRCVLAVSVADAHRLAAGLGNPVLAGEVHGDRLQGFDMGNSPAGVNRLPEDGRPLVLLSSSGTALTANVARSNRAFVACLRNDLALARWLIQAGDPVLLAGAETRGEFRDEDQLCCARMAGVLLEAGFEPRGATEEMVRRWSGAAPDAALRGASARYLERSGQLEDLEFIRSHIDDQDEIFAVSIDGPHPGAPEVLSRPASAGASASAGGMELALGETRAHWR